MAEAPDAHLPAQRLARLIYSGAMGHELFEKLCAELPTITRSETFWGIGLGVTELQLALFAAEAEIDALRRELASQMRRAA